MPRYIRITDFNHNGLLKDGSFKSLPLDKAAGYYLKNGDVLFARSGATVGKTFIFYGEDKKACFAGYLIKASTTRHLLSPRFLYFYTKSPAYDIWKNSIFTQATIQNIGADKYAYLPIIVPPITEQKRITQYLDQRCGKLDAFIAIKQQQIKELDALQRNTISEAVTRGFRSSEFKETGNIWMPEIPEHWKLVNLKRVSKIQTGFTLGKQYEGKLIERPYLRVANVQDGHLNLTDLTTIEVPVNVAWRVELRAGDVLMTEGGDLDKLGRGTVWNADIPSCLHQNHIFAVRCFQHKLLPAFLAYLTTSRYGRDYFEATGKRTTNLASAYSGPT